MPALKPATKPVLETVATAVLEEVHALVEAAVPLPNNWVVVFAQITIVPEMVGNGFTVTVVVVWQPLELV